MGQCLKTCVIEKWEEKCPDWGKMPGDIFPKTMDFFSFFFNFMTTWLSMNGRPSIIHTKIFLFQTGWMGRSAGWSHNLSPEGLKKRKCWTSQTISFLHTVSLSNLKDSVGLILSKTSMRVSITIDWSARTFVNVPRFIPSRRPPPLLTPKLILFPHDCLSHTWCTHFYEILQSQYFVFFLSNE